MPPHYVVVKLLVPRSRDEEVAVVVGYARMGPLAGVAEAAMAVGFAAELGVAVLEEAPVECAGEEAPVEAAQGVVEAALARLVVVAVCHTMMPGMPMDKETGLLPPCPCLERSMPLHGSQAKEANPPSSQRAPTGSVR